MNDHATNLKHTTKCINQKDPRQAEACNMSWNGKIHLMTWANLLAVPRTPCCSHPPNAQSNCCDVQLPVYWLVGIEPWPFRHWTISIMWLLVSAVPLPLAVHIPACYDHWKQLVQQMVMVQQLAIAES